MKKFILAMGVVSCLFLGALAWLSKPLPVVNVSLTKAFLAKGITIVDIRDDAAWKKVGVLPGSHLLTYEYEEMFLKKIEQLVSKDETFALLSESGEISAKVAQLLATHGFNHVINLVGGMKQGLKNKIPLVHL